jgi:hypothetical protein
MASSRSVVRPWPWEHAHTRAASFAGTSRTSSPSATSRRASERPAPRQPSTARRGSCTCGQSPPAARSPHRHREPGRLDQGLGHRAQHGSGVAGLMRVNGDHHVVAQGVPPRYRVLLARRAMQLPAAQTSLEPHPHRAAGTGRRPFVSQSTPPADAAATMAVAA